MKIYANITNGLCFPHNDVCHFMSTHGHSFKMGYLRLDSMPYSAAIELLRGQDIIIKDASQHNKPLTDGLRYGVSTWAMIFNRAIGSDHTRVAPWTTKEMWYAAYRTDVSSKIVQRIRRLKEVYGDCGPVNIFDRSDKIRMLEKVSPAILLECHRNFKLDDKPKEMRGLINVT